MLFSSGWRRWLAAAGSALLFGLVALAVLHTPPVRARMLAWIASRLAAAGIVLQADQLDYSLARLDVRIRHLRLAASNRPSEPFLTAQEVRAVFGWRLLVGQIDVDRFEAAGLRIVLARNADSVLDLPAPQPPSVRTPVQQHRAPLPEITFHRVRVSDLDVVWRDAVTGSAVDASGLSIELDAEGTAAAGPLHLARPARVRWNNRSELLKSLDGRLSWNGRDLSVESLRAAFNAGRLQIDGRINALTRDPHIDLRITADADVAALAPWLTATPQPMAGALRVEANVAAAGGQPPSLVADIILSGRDLTLGRLHDMQLETSARIRQNTADIAAIRLQAAGGSITGHGQMTLNASSGRIEIGWNEIDLGRLVDATAGGDLPVLPSAVAAGSLDAVGAARRLDSFRLRSESRLAARGADAAAPDGRGSAGRLPLEGAVSLQVDRGRLTIRAEQAIGEAPGGSGEPQPVATDRRARATIDIAATLDGNELARSPIGGVIRLNAADLGDVARRLTQAGIVDAHLLQAGTMRSEFSLASARLMAGFCMRACRQRAPISISVSLGRGPAPTRWSGWSQMAGFISRLARSTGGSIWHSGTWASSRALFHCRSKPAAPSMRAAALADPSTLPASRPRSPAGTLRPPASTSSVYRPMCV